MFGYSLCYLKVKLGGVIVNSSFIGSELMLNLGCGLNLDNLRPTVSVNQADSYKQTGVFHSICFIVLPMPSHFNSFPTKLSFFASYFPFFLPYILFTSVSFFYSFFFLFFFSSSFLPSLFSSALEKLSKRSGIGLAF